MKNIHRRGKRIVGQQQIQLPPRSLPVTGKIDVPMAGGSCTGRMRGSNTATVRSEIRARRSRGSLQRYAARRALTGFESANLAPVGRTIAAAPGSCGAPHAMMNRNPPKKWPGPLSPGTGCRERLSSVVQIKKRIFHPCQINPQGE